MKEENKTSINVCIEGLPEAVDRVKKIMLASSDEVKLNFIEDMPKEKDEEKPTFIRGKVYAYTPNGGKVERIFIAKGEPYPSEYYDDRIDISSRLWIGVGDDILHPISLFLDDIEVGCNTEYCRPATREEINLLRKVLYEHDLVWDAKKQQVVKRETVQAWKPTNGQPCWICYHFSREREFLPILVEDGEAYHEEIKRGWAFPTKQDCQRMCDKLNAAILQTSINEQIGL